MSYTFQYETIVNKSFLITTLENSKELINYQMQMLANNNIPNILPVVKRQKNDDVQLCYNVTSKVSLKQAYSRSKISRDGFIKLIEGIILLMNELEEYQLVSTGLVFDSDYIFVKAGSFDPEFVYMPIHSEDLGIKPLKDFLLNLILQSKVEITNDNFIQIILDTLNSSDVSLKKLQETIRDLNKGSITSRSDGKLQHHDIQSLKKPDDVRYISDAENVPKPVITPKTEPIAAGFHKNIPEKVPERGGSKVKKKSKDEKAQHPKKNLFMFVQLGLLAVIVALSLSGIINNDDGSVNLRYLMGIVIPVAGFDFILYREWFINQGKGENKKSKTKIKKDGKSTVKNPASNIAIPGRKSSERHDTNERISPISPVASIASTEPPEYTEPDDINPINIYKKEGISEKAFYNSIQETHDTDDAGDTGDTEVFEETGATNPYLEYYENGLMMKIQLNKSIVVVGRMKNQVDYAISNKKVGKIHAEFITETDGIYVKDYNSTNGTYINGSTQRISGNTPYHISNGDKIALADVELTLRC